MKKLIIFCIIQISFYNTIFAENNIFNWATSFGHQHSESWPTMNPFSCEVDASNNLISIGTFNGIVDFDPDTGRLIIPTGLSMNNFYITKTSPNGNLIWVKTIFISSYPQIVKLKLDDNGNIIIFGTFEDNIDFDPLTSVGLYHSDYLSIFVSKFDSSGNFINANFINGIKSGSAFVNTDFNIDESKNFIISGIAFDSVDFDPGINVFTPKCLVRTRFVAKYDSSFNLVWVRDFADSAFTSYEGLVVTTDERDNIYLSGEYMRNFSIFKDDSLIFSLASSNGVDMFLLKLNKNGDYIWLNQYGSFYSDIPYSIVYDNNGHLYIGGQCLGRYVGIDYRSNTFILKADTSGSVIWDNKYYGYGKSECVSIKVGADNNIYFTGNYTDSIDLDWIYYGGVFKSSGKEDVYICKIDSNGIYIWGNSLGGGDSDYSYDLCLDKFNNVYTVGIYTDILYILTSPGVYFYLESPINSYQIFTYKIGYSPPIITCPISNLKLCSGLGTYISVQGRGTIRWYSTMNRDSLLHIGDTFYTPILYNSVTYYLLDSLNTTFFPVNIQVFDMPHITGYTLSTVCDSDRAVLSANSSIGGVIWNRDSIGGPILWRGNNYTTPYITENTTYYLDAINGACYSATRVPVTAIVSYKPKILYSNDTFVCGSNRTLIRAIPDSGFISWYADIFFTDFLDRGNIYNTPIINSSTRYYYQGTYGVCKSDKKYLDVFYNSFNSTINRDGTQLSCEQSGATYQWINCTTNSIISGATSQSYTPTINGTYAVVINTGPCLDTSECISVLNIGMEEKNITNNISIYPNPTTQKFFIELNANAEIKITNAVGEILLNEKRNAGIQEFDLENFASGMYFVKVIEKNKEQTLKLIKE